jgi:hypothetical protein
VIAHHYDQNLPGRPLNVLIIGASLALAALGLIVTIIVKTWHTGTLPESTGIVLLVLLVPVYIGSVFLFSYGYEVYDVPRALRLTAIIVFLTLAAVVMLAALAVVLGALKGGSSSSSSSSSRSESSSRRTGGRRSAGYGGWYGGGLYPIGGTREREVVREVPVPAPAPQPVACPHCGRSYIPEDTEFACPGCGAGAPDLGRRYPRA